MNKKSDKRGTKSTPEGDHRWTPNGMRQALHPYSPTNSQKYDPEKPTEDSTEAETRPRPFHPCEMSAYKKLERKLQDINQNYDKRHSFPSRKKQPTESQYSNYGTYRPGKPANQHRQSSPISGKHLFLSNERPNFRDSGSVETVHSTISNPDLGTEPMAVNQDQHEQWDLYNCLHQLYGQKDDSPPEPPRLSPATYYDQQSQMQHYQNSSPMEQTSYQNPQAMQHPSYHQEQSPVQQPSYQRTSDQMYQGTYDIPPLMPFSEYTQPTATTSPHKSALLRNDYSHPVTPQSSSHSAQQRYLTPYSKTSDHSPSYRTPVPNYAALPPELPSYSTPTRSNPVTGYNSYNPPRKAAPPPPPLPPLREENAYILSIIRAGQLSALVSSATSAQLDEMINELPDRGKTNVRKLIEKEKARLESEAAHRPNSKWNRPNSSLKMTPYTCNTCNYVCSTLKDFQHHLTTLVHKDNLQKQVGPAMMTLLPANEAYCVVCSVPYPTMLALEPDFHPNSNSHKRKERLSKRGCLLCKTGPFKKYQEYVSHIDGDVHKMKKNELQSELNNRKAEIENKISKDPKLQAQVEDGRLKTIRSRMEEEEGIPDLETMVTLDEVGGEEDILEKRQEKLTREERNKIDLSVFKFNPKVSVGVECVIPTFGFYCKLCHKFYEKEDVAKNEHCKSQSHFEKYRKYIKIKQVWDEKARLERESEEKKQAARLKAQKEQAEKWLAEKQKAKGQEEAKPSNTKKVNQTSGTNVPKTTSDTNVKSALPTADATRNGIEETSVEDKPTPKKKRIVKKIVKRLVIKSKDGRIIKSTHPGKVLSRKMTSNGDVPVLTETPVKDGKDITDPEQEENKENPQVEKEVTTDLELPEVNKTKLEENPVNGEATNVEDCQKETLPLELSVEPAAEAKKAVIQEPSVPEISQQAEAIPLETGNQTNECEKAVDSAPMEVTSDNPAPCKEEKKVEEEKLPDAAIAPIAKPEGEIVIKNGRRVRIIKKRVVKRRSKEPQDTTSPSKNPCLEVETQSAKEAQGTTPPSKDPCLEVDAHEIKEQEQENSKNKVDVAASRRDAVVEQAAPVAPKEASEEIGRKQSPQSQDDDNLSPKDKIKQKISLKSEGSPSDQEVTLGTNDNEKLPAKKEIKIVLTGESTKRKPRVRRK
ncbi:hypothetical protein CAPTEDRAFT_198848 [Capitella teleta]|uniref:Matrin-type domain-containing protein n=1 Tax=Capitella teleta TaxID=283909 RepID=R7T3S9_CAPTE|nr:hypothetical protein CAPTEDRAFT_198848 [Capitella teleta]|eukprot:ELT87472.1 hypothetical protein CAPTEDRAFT_198848 [Capitella teleta]